MYSMLNGYLDRLFPWRVGVCDWELKRWQRPLLIYWNWSSSVACAIHNVWLYLICKPESKPPWVNHSVARDVKLVLISLLFIVGWFKILYFLGWRVYYKLSAAKLNKKNW